MSEGKRRMIKTRGTMMLATAALALMAGLPSSALASDPETTIQHSDACHLGYFTGTDTTDGLAPRTELYWGHCGKTTPNGGQLEVDWVDNVTDYASQSGICTTGAVNLYGRFSYYAGNGLVLPTSNESYDYQGVVSVQKGPVITDGNGYERSTLTGTGSIRIGLSGTGTMVINGSCMDDPYAYNGHPVFQGNIDVAFGGSSS
jgi:hypothetical protein